MSSEDTRDGMEEKRRAFADAFDLEADPLAKYDSQFRDLNSDPLEMYAADVLAPRGLSESRQNDYWRVFQQFKEHMQQQRWRPHSSCRRFEATSKPLTKATEREALWCSND